MINTLLAILVFVLIAAIVLWLVKVMLDHLPIDTTLKNFVIAIVAAILLVLFLAERGIF